MTPAEREVAAKCDPKALDRIDISAIVVNWNTCDLLVDCLGSLRAYAPAGRSLEIIVVDNGSQDGSAEVVRQSWPDVELIANAQNEGFSRANNRAIRRSRGNFLLLINSDARLTPGCLDTLLARMEADFRIGAAGPRLVYGDGQWQRWTAGLAPGLRSAANYFLFLEHLSRRPAAGIYLTHDVRNSFQPEWVSGACMLLRREATDEVGLLDERYFAYMDDVDLCQRLRDAAWTIWYLPEAEAVHLMGQSTHRQTGTISPDALRNFNRYFVERHGAFAGTILQVMEVAGFALRAAAYFAWTVLRPGETRSREKARLHWRHLILSLGCGAYVVPGRQRNIGIP